MTAFTPIDFIRESNRIEGILREPTQQEIEEYHRFMRLVKVQTPDLMKFVEVYQPNARLRVKLGDDVRVGKYLPPAGGTQILNGLQGILNNIPFKSAYETHLAYENLHPFTDGNGRSGRMLWMWQMQDAPLGFLHHFYYQTLANQDDRA